MSNKIIIRAAIESDSDAILNFLRDSYYPEEPLTKALEPFQQAEEDEQFNLSCIKYGTCVIAYYDNVNVADTTENKTTIETNSTTNTSSSNSNSTVAINFSSSTTGNNDNKNKNDVADDNSKMNFLNHEARNQQHQKTDSCNQHHEHNGKKQNGNECNSNQCNQNYHSNNHHQQNLLNNTLELNATTERPVKEQQQQQEQLKNIHSQKSIVVVKELLGVMIAGPKYPGEAEHLMDASNTVKNIKWSKMLKLLSYLELKSNVFNKFNCQSAVHCHAMATNRLARGQSIGLNMLKEFIKICKKLKYPVITLDCTSIYSIRLCEKLNMICLNELKFDDYRNDFGEQVFRPPSPHNIIKTFGKKITDNIDDD